MSYICLRKPSDYLVVRYATVSGVVFAVMYGCIYLRTSEDDWKYRSIDCIDGHEASCDTQFEAYNMLAYFTVFLGFRICAYVISRFLFFFGMSENSKYEKKSITLRCVVLSVFVVTETRLKCVKTHCVSPACSPDFPVVCSTPLHHQIEVMW